MGFEYLKKKQPRFLFICLDETDDFAHNGNYDFYLNSIKSGDLMISELWNYLQSNEFYKDKTTLLLTCDHGRGNGPVEWKSHGTKTPNSSETWFAIIGPEIKAKGEIKDGQFYNNQYAKTLAALLGFDFTNNNKAGNKINMVLGE
jgi:arylsulfatase A-like enzyme